jgi:TPR repeat protein
MPEMSNQIQHGLQNMNLGGHDSFNSTTSSRSSRQAYDYSQPGNQYDAPHLSPFPKLINPPPNVPPSDEELEATLENARALVLGANDPEMQLAWAADAMIYVGACMDNEERISAIKPQSARSSTPRIEHQLKTDAMNIVTFLADQHHPKAEFLRGMWLEWGRFGQREDKKEAFRCYSRAADRGYARAEYRIGMLYESYNDPIKALRHYHRGVDAGDAASCYRLGMMTLRGQHGQQQDYAKAIDLIKHSAQAADENAAQGAYVYGMLLARQLPQVDIPESYLPFDERLARINIEKAAYLKFAKAQLKMGSAYELGSLGCDFNPALSMHYNALASKQGEAEADMALSKWFLVGSEGILPKNEELSYTYAQRAAHSGLATAEFALGYFHEIGMYVPVDLEKSREWYEKAAKHGNEDAKGRIEALARKQVLNRKDHENITVKRITSQYGSKRGGRPERFKQQPPQPSSNLAGSPLDDASVYSQSPGTPLTHSASFRMPSAPNLTTPYPMEDGPPPAGRAPSVAPYPLEEGPPKQRLGPVGGFFNAPQLQRPATAIQTDMRPSSAFQINPELRAQSTAAVPTIHHMPPQHQQQYQQQPQQYPVGRPYPPSAYPPVATNQPRPTTLPANDPRGRYGPSPIPNQRIMSGPPGGGMQQRPGPSASVPPPQSAPPGVDIGFSAPHDDRRRQYGVRPPATAVGVSQRPPGSPALQSSNSMPAFDRPQGRTSAPSSRPASRPPPGPADVPGRKPVTLTDGPALPSPSTTPKPAGAVAKPPAAKPGKGPKTFEEMGVPAHKQEGECSVM